MTPILPLRLSGVTVKKRGRTLIGPIDLDLGPNGVTLVIGPNGAGKTTLLRLIHGLERPSSGRAEWQVPTRNALRRQAFIFQHPILMRRSVLDNIAYPLMLRGTDKRAARAQAEIWAARTGIAEHLAAPARSLSGGEKQKLAMARAMIASPDLLLLDEPTSHLDGRATREFEALLADAIAAGTSVIMATHDMGQARRLGGETLFIYRGQVHEQGPTAQLLETPQSEKTHAFVKGDIVE